MCGCEDVDVEMWMLCVLRCGVSHQLIAPDIRERGRDKGWSKRGRGGGESSIRREREESAATAVVAGEEACRILHLARMSTRKDGPGRDNGRKDKRKDMSHTVRSDC